MQEGREGTLNYKKKTGSQSFLIIWIKDLGYLVLNIDWLVQTCSVNTSIMILIYRTNNFVYCH